MKKTMKVYGVCDITGEPVLHCADAKPWGRFYRLCDPVSMENRSVGRAYGGGRTVPADTAALTPRAAWELYRARQDKLVQGARAALRAAGYARKIASDALALYVDN